MTVLTVPHCVLTRTLQSIHTVKCQLINLCVCFAASVPHGLDLVQVLVNVSASDGSVSAWTTGCEIGQGLFVKVAGTISQALGVDINKVSVMEVNTQVSVTVLSSCSLAVLSLLRSLYSLAVALLMTHVFLSGHTERKDHRRLDHFRVLLLCSS